MQQRQPLLAAALWGLAAVAAAGSLPRGVGPEFASYYQSHAESDFSCISQPSIRISSSRINDNSCDCPDGSDEPGTAACAHIDPRSPPQPLPGSPSGTTNTTNALPGFWCANKGHIGAYLPFSYVNDGACDHNICCDGSDEFTRVKCPDRCVEMGRQHRAREAEKQVKIQKAQKKREALIAEAARLRQAAESKLATLTAELASLETQKTALEAKHAEVKAQEAGKVVKSPKSGGGGGKLGVLVGLAKTRVEELRQMLDNVVTDRGRLQAQVDELKALFATLKTDYNPNFNDEGVKAVIKSFEDISAREAAEATTEIIDADVDALLKEDGPESGVDWTQFENQSEDTDILYNLEAYLPAFLRTKLHDKLQTLRVWLVRKGVLAENIIEGTESQLVKAAREAAESASRKVSDTQRDITSTTDDLAKDYGPSDIFRALSGQSVSIEAGEYTYEMTWLDKTSQSSKKGGHGGQTNMGNFVRIDREIADDDDADRPDGRSLGRGVRFVLRYEDGLQCWNGPRRRTDVWLACAEKDELWRVSEAEKCVYKMEMGSPVACEPASDRGGGTKDEL